VVCAESDPALIIAARIAVAAGEALRIVARSVAGVTPEDVVQGLGTSNERLVVLARGACGTDNAAVSSHIAASRGVPVLVVEP
jgi:hypothetical protein